MKLIRFFVFVLATVALTSRAQEVKITGYQPGEFAVKNGIEQQLNTNVVKRIGSAMTRATSEDLRIFVTGHADKTGSGAENDRIALARAEQVKEFLSEQFPKATITNLTKGDEANARMVTISWKITAAQPAPQQKKSNSGMIVLVAAMIGIAIVIIIFIAVIIAAARPKVTQPVQLAPLAIEQAPATSKPEVIEIEQNDRTLRVRIDPEGDGFVTPFTINGKPIFRQKLSDAIASVKGCVADKQNPTEAQKEFKRQLTELIANGKIEAIEKGVVS
jgi:hypothetical protein